jgi:hypothetical protein
MSLNLFEKLSRTHAKSHEMRWGVFGTVDIHCIAYMLFFMTSLICSMIMLLCRAIHSELDFWSCCCDALWQEFQETSWDRSQIRGYQTGVAPRYEPRWVAHIPLESHPYARPLNVQLRKQASCFLAPLIPECLLPCCLSQIH